MSCKRGQIHEAFHALDDKDNFVQSNTTQLELHNGLRRYFRFYHKKNQRFFSPKSYLYIEESNLKWSYQVRDEAITIHSYLIVICKLRFVALPHIALNDDCRLSWVLVNLIFTIHSSAGFT